ncbi:MAG: class I SAM-dependent methyltransferase [Ignavibacteriales bacterium]|nr:class I SAM-dependent methyltransferase [Ignavibacteriales bacterium]
MNIEMYRIFFNIQQEHWWFVTKKSIVLDTISKYLPANINHRILDIGCGSGLMLNSLEAIGQTYGMDMSDDAINFSKELFNGKVEKGFLPNQIPYDNNFFNLITALDVIEHIDQDVESLKVMHSCLAKDGKAIITVPAYMFLWSAFDEMNQHKRRYTLTELKTKLLDAGYTIKKITYFNTLLFPIVYAVRILNNILKRSGASDIEMPGKISNYILKKVFGIEKYLLRYINLPFGVSILTVVEK